jgi:hypothetical protein
MPPSFRRDDLADRSHKMAVGCELAARVQRLKLGHRAIYRRDGRRQRDSTIHAGALPDAGADSAYRMRSEYPVAHGHKEDTGKEENSDEATGENEKSRPGGRRGLFDSVASIK